jgi:MerR family transcriptional regulator, thiopeptide resistance regulator
VDERVWKVGELAEATGITVRALRHFDVIGLLRPAQRTAGGHRLYTAGDVRRLYRILALRRLGVPLAEIARSLDGQGDDLGVVVAGQLEQVDRELELLHRLRRRLARLAGAIRDTREPSIDDVIEAMEATMRASYFSPEQLARAKARHAEPGFAEAFARWLRECADIVAELAVHVDQGADPAGPEVQELAWRWRDVMEQMSGGDRSGLSSIYAKIDGEGPQAATRGILNTEVWEYLKRAFAVGFGSTR